MGLLLFLVQELVLLGVKRVRLCALPLDYVLQDALVVLDQRVVLLEEPRVMVQQDLLVRQVWSKFTALAIIDKKTNELLLRKVKTLVLELHQVQGLAFRLFKQIRKTLQILTEIPRPLRYGSQRSTGASRPPSL